jgi:hypothetical protein
VNSWAALSWIIGSYSVLGANRYQLTFEKIARSIKRSTLLDLRFHVPLGSAAVNFVDQVRLNANFKLICFLSAPIEEIVYQ